MSKFSLLNPALLLLLAAVLVQCDTVNPHTGKEPTEAQLLEAQHFMLWLNPDLESDAHAEYERKIAQTFFQIRQRYSLRDARLSQPFALPWNPRTIFVQLDIADLHHYNATGEYPWNEESGVALPERVQKFNVGVEFFALSYNFDFNPHSFCREFLGVEGVARCDASYGRTEPGAIPPVIVEEKGAGHLVFWFTGGDMNADNLARVEVEGSVYRFSNPKSSPEFNAALMEAFRDRGRASSPREI